MKKLNTIFQPLALQFYSPFAKAGASCTHISCVNTLRCAWAYNIMMARSIMQRCSNHVVMQNTVFNHTKNEFVRQNTVFNHTNYKFVWQNTVFNNTNYKVVWQNTVFNHTKNEIIEKNFITNHTNGKMVWKSVRTRHSKQLVRCRNDTTEACCTIVHLKRCMPTAWGDASAI